jgi:hypothetical protein
MAKTKTQLITEVTALERGLEAVLKELRALVKKKVAPKSRSDKKARKVKPPVFRTVIK